MACRSRLLCGLVAWRPVTIVGALLALATNTLAAAPATRPAAPLELRESALTLAFVRLPAGQLEIPSPDPRKSARKIQIKSFSLAATELPWPAYDIYYLRLDVPDNDPQKNVALKTHPSLPYGVADRGFGHEGFPVIGIHSNAAIAYCKWLSRKTGHAYRLPTEYEWEYAARAGSSTEPFASESELKILAWFRDNSLNDNDDPVSRPVASKKPNSWGLYDMLGNVAEWTIADDGTPVTKGGSFKDSPKLLSTRARVPLQPGWQLTDPEAPKSIWWLRDGPHVGFRLARDD